MDFFYFLWVIKVINEGFEDFLSEQWKVKRSRRLQIFTIKYLELGGISWALGTVEGELSSSSIPTVQKKPLCKVLFYQKKAVNCDIKEFSRKTCAKTSIKPFDWSDALHPALSHTRLSGLFQFKFRFVSQVFTQKSLLHCFVSTWTRGSTFLLYQHLFFCRWKSRKIFCIIFFFLLSMSNRILKSTILVNASANRRTLNNYFG